MLKHQEKITIELWGTYPPPFGGVTVHVKRLLHGLNSFGRFNAMLLNFNGTVHDAEQGIFQVRLGFTPFLSLLFKSKRIIHLHTRQRVAWMLVALLGKRHKRILTLHNQTLRDEAHGLKKWLLGRTLRQFDLIFLNDPEFKKFLVKVFQLSPSRLILTGAFLPPTMSEYEGVPEYVLNFRKKKRYLISATAWMFVLKNGKDIYGMDTLVRLISRLKKDGWDVGLIFLLPQTGDVEYLRLIKKRIEKLNLKEDILFIDKPVTNAFEIWGVSDLFIRPTLSDIEGISIKEALYMGTPVIATNVCDRPKECYVYAPDDFETLYRYTKKLLQEKNNQKIQFKESALNTIVNYYDKLALKVNV